MGGAGAQVTAGDGCPSKERPPGPQTKGPEDEEPPISDRSSRSPGRGPGDARPAALACSSTSPLSAPPWPSPLWSGARHASLVAAVPMCAASQQGLSRAGHPRNPPRRREAARPGPHRHLCLSEGE